MKYISTEVWGFLMGKDVLVCTIEGCKDELVEKLSQMSGIKDSAIISTALDRAVWSEDIQWVGGHQLGMMVKGIQFVIPEEKEPFIAPNDIFVLDRGSYAHIHS